MALWVNFDKIRPDATPEQQRSWVWWQVRSVFYQLRRRKTLTVESLAEHTECSVNEEEAEEKEVLESLMAALDPDERHIVQFHLDGYRGDEIGQQMGISRNNYYQRMHRAIGKMKRLALTLAALVAASSLAIAVIPQWRHAVFRLWQHDAEAVDSLPEEKTAPPVIKQLSDTIASQQTPQASIVKTMTVIEPMQPLYTFQYYDDVPFLEPHIHQDSISVTLEGSRLTIIGAKGETVKVFDLAGHLVAMQTADNICIIDILPPTDVFSGWSRYTYCLTIGNRPPIMVYL